MLCIDNDNGYITKSTKEYPGQVPVNDTLITLYYTELILLYILSYLTLVEN